jgi:TolB protein
MHPRRFLGLFGAPLLVAFVIAAASPAVAVGRQIIFTRLFYGSARPGIFAVNLDASGMRRISTGSDFAPEYSPRGHEIVFQRSPGRIFIMNSDGSDLKRLFRRVHAHAGGPTFSPDGKKIAFSAEMNGRFQIFTMSVRGTHVNRVTSGPGDKLDPAWRGTKIAFDMNVGGNSDIYVMSDTGQNITRLTTNKAHDSSPAWSPSGKRIAFSRWGGSSKGDIWVMGAAGANPHKVTNGPSFDFAPSFSPHGGWIAFGRSAPGNTGDIWIVRANGTGLHQVTTRPSEDIDPDWRP